MADRQKVSELPVVFGTSPSLATTLPIDFFSPLPMSAFGHSGQWPPSAIQRENDMSQKEDELVKVRDKGDWSSHDNKGYRGKIDRVHVALSEAWETKYFIDHYLETRGYSVTNKNRDLVAAQLESYTGRAPFKRVALNAYLDAAYGVKPHATHADTERNLDQRDK